MSGLEILVALAIAVGLVGIVVPLLPGSLLVVAAILVWAWDSGTGAAWAVFAVATTFVALGTVVKYVVPGRRLRTAGVPGSTIVLGGLLALVGFFVIPVVGLVIGFVGGVYLAELRRLGSEGAWPSTRHAVRAVGLSLLIELFASLCAAATWATGVVLL